jgi:hypothetical protein
MTTTIRPVDVCGHDWHHGITCAIGRRIDQAREAANVADILVGTMTEHDPTEAIRVLATTAPPAHVALPSYGYSPTRLAWIPRWQHIGPQGHVRRVRMADRYVTAEVETIDPRGSHVPTAADQRRGFVPMAVSGTGESTTWSADEDQAHRQSLAAERRGYVTWWRQALGITSKRDGRKARPITAASAPVLANVTSVRVAVAAALTGPGVWHLQNGLTLTRTGDVVMLFLGERPYVSRDGVPSTPRGLASWVDRNVAAWHAANAQAQAEHETQVPESLGAAMADVG